MPARSATALAQSCRHGWTAACDGSVGFVRVEADVGGGQRWNELDDQLLRCDTGVPIDQMPYADGPMHGGLSAGIVRMSDDSAEIRLTVLWPVNEVDQVDDGRLTEFYTYPSTTCSRAGCAAT